MRRNPWLAGLLSLLVPGLGQIYWGEGNRGAAISGSARANLAWTMPGKPSTSRRPSTGGYAG